MKRGRKAVDVLKKNFSICLPVELLEILDSYCALHGVSRSSGLSYLLARSLDGETDILRDTNYEFIITNDDAYILKRARPENDFTDAWVFSMNEEFSGGKRIKVFSADGQLIVSSNVNFPPRVSVLEHKSDKRVFTLLDGRYVTNVYVNDGGGDVVLYDNEPYALGEDGIYHSLPEEGEDD